MSSVFLALTPATPAWLVAPFALLLLLIAVMPLTRPRLKHLWERHYPLAAGALAALVVGYYLLAVPGGGTRVAHSAHEYFSFIALIGSLFVVAGGIHLGVRGEATPRENVLFLFFGAVLANVIGTTGASMVLVRPFIRMNKIRVSAHHIVFFIFLVSNIGGALTPIGDPPLFIGFLRGVPFFWLGQHVLAAWLTTVALVLAVFYAFDRRSFSNAPAQIRDEIEHTRDTWRLDGKRNLLFLAIVVGAVFAPEKYFMRELLMLAAAGASFVVTPRQVHESNHFNFAPIKEVAFLFAGIFLTMMPALDYVAEHAAQFALTRPAHYFYACGGLSAVLDNAPAYANFLTLAQARTPGGADISTLLAQAPLIVAAISLGAVFFGAITYIGNGPNFMVRSIAERADVRTPTFFGYLFKYSLPILLPIFALVGWFFL